MPFLPRHGGARRYGTPAIRNQSSWDAWGRGFRLPRMSRASVWLFHRLDALDEVGEFRPIPVPHRLHRLLIRLLVGIADGNDGDARGLGLGHRRLLVLVPELALLELRFAREFFDQRLIILRQAVPDLL